MKNTSVVLRNLCLVGALAMASVFGLSNLHTAQADGGTVSPVVVELFTSQGCSSCPPADAVLNELAGRDDVIALSLPITYWDNLGWPDTFADQVHTKRQRSYAGWLSNRRVYTPQMVINGEIDVVGSRRQTVLNTIEREKDAGAASIDVSIDMSDGQLTVSLAKAPAGLKTALSDTPAAILIAPYHADAQTVMIRAGENNGRTIAYSNVVRGLMKIGTYDGKSMSLDHSFDSEDGSFGCAVLVQDNLTGRIIGAGKLARWN